MATIQAREDINNEPFVLDDSAEVNDSLTLAANQGALTRGAALGEVTSSGELAVVDGTATDGSQIPKYLLADESVPANTGATQTISGYTAGLFDEDQISFASTATTLTTQVVLSTDDSISSSMKDILRTYGIRTAPVISEGGLENA